MGDSDELTRAEARVGTIVHNKYRLDAVLGVGGMAVVYAATHRNRKRFAVKMLHPELSQRQDIRERFIREGYVANTVEHPNALAVLDDDVAEDGAAFVVMELLDGLTIDDLLQRCGEKLPVRAGLSIVHQLLDVLAAAHRKEIVHRDIKPANVFVLHDGTVKVLDFGIARLRDSTNKASSSTGMMLGTPAFLPPEQAIAKSSQIDHRTDIWAVGATMFNLLTGAYVHVAETAAEMVVITATQPARSVLRVAPDLSPQIAAIVDKALAFDKAMRWESAELMRQAIGAAHVAVFGDAPSKASIGELMAPFRPPDRSSSPSLPSGTGIEAPFSTPAIAAPVTSLDIPTTGPTQVASTGRNGLVSTTSKPVVTGADAVPGRAPRPKLLGVVVTLVLALSVASGLALAWTRLGRSTSTPSGAASAVAEASVKAPVQPRGSPSETASVASASPEAPSATADAAPSTTASVAPPKAGSSTPKPAFTPVVPALVAPPPPPPKPSPSARPKAMSCTPPYEFDAAGKRHWKPECL